jgi:hypothetical protein
MAWIVGALIDILALVVDERVALVALAHRIVIFDLTNSFAARNEIARIDAAIELQVTRLVRLTLLRARAFDTEATDFLVVWIAQEAKVA